MKTTNKVKCTHPDHVEGESCEDRAVGCHPNCKCCMGKYTSEALLIMGAKTDYKNRKKITELKKYLRISYGFIRTYLVLRNQGKPVNDLNFPEELMEEIRTALTNPPH